MRIVLDTNVFVSAFFWGGIPKRVMDAWRDGRVELAVSPEILEEYRRVGEELSSELPNEPLNRLLELLVSQAHQVDPPPFPRIVVKSDPSDDKFLACALAGRATIIASGDKHLLALNAYGQVSIMTPRAFVDRFLA